MADAAKATMQVALKVALDFASLERIDTPALVAWTTQQKQPLPAALNVIDRNNGGRIQELVKSGEITGKAGEAVIIHHPGGLTAKRLVLLGAGETGNLSAAKSSRTIRNMASWAARFLKGKGIVEFALWFPENFATPDAAQAAAEGAGIGNFDIARYQTGKAAKEQKKTKAVQLTGFDKRRRTAVEKAIERGQIIAEAQNFTRELANEPSNLLTPKLFADRARRMAKSAGLKIEVLDEKQIAKLKMGALLSVAQGSVEPPRVVVLRYSHPRAPKNAPVLGLVGKGVTFDTGGISIKPSAGMEKMKYDMSGGATMAGVMYALGRLKPVCKLIAVIPLTENMPDGKSQKPGDVRYAMSGKSIEVINTDAEGRLVLADGLHYARQLGATHLIDAATLTGAVVVALGSINAGAFTNNPKFLQTLLASAKATGENIWELPMNEEYSENIRSSIADIQNVGKGRGAGATTGAVFLREFVEDETPWIHLDIAGTAWLDNAKPFMPAGPTGVTVRTLIHLAESFGRSQSKGTRK